MIPLPSHIAEYADSMIAEVMPFSYCTKNMSKLQAAKALVQMRIKDIIKFGGDADTFKKVSEYVAAFCPEQKMLDEKKEYLQDRGIINIFS